MSGKIKRIKKPPPPTAAVCVCVHVCAIRLKFQNSRNNLKDIIPYQRLVFKIPRYYCHNITFCLTVGLFKRQKVEGIGFTFQLSPCMDSCITKPVWEGVF